MRRRSPRLLVGILVLATEATARVLSKLTVEIRTADATFAGTDDDIHIEFRCRPPIVHRLRTAP